ncbi:MAG: DUF971 domain-containing protein [Myxococcaceae bacterium]
MSLWDHIKPSKAPPVATQLELSPDRHFLVITWDDGAQSRLSAKTLRGLCPCAVCVDEWTNQRRHDPSKVADTTTFQGLQPMGNYAVNLAFSDSHSTGIYTWQYLRELGEGQTAK